MKQNVAILLYDDAEVLDFAGPIEVFSVTSQINDYQLFDVFTVAQMMDPITAINGLSVNPTYDFVHCPPVHILIIPGGDGSKQAILNQSLLSWVHEVHAGTAWTMSVCSGSRSLGTLGILDGQPYCTHHEVYEAMHELTPFGLPQPDKRVVQAGSVFTSGGISAGIDLSFHMVEMLHGKEIASKTAKYMEYDWKG